MNKIKLSLLTAGLLVVVQNLNAIEMTDYQVIEGTYENAYVGGQLQVNDGNQDQTSYNASGVVSYENIYTTAPFVWNLQVDGIADISKGPNDGDSSQSNYDTQLNTDINKYLNNDDTTFIYGSTSMEYAKSSNASSGDDAVNIGVGAGYGRMYIATPLAKALRIIADLREHKLITKNVSDEALMSLAKVIHVENEYISKHGNREYKQYWYTDMEKSLQASGVLGKEGLGAFGTVRIEDVLEVQRPNERLHGWLVKGGIGQDLSNFTGLDKETTADAMFDYALPIGYQSQFRNTAILRKSLDAKTTTDYTFDNTLSYTYEVANNIDWENSWLLGFTKGDNNIEDVTTNSLSSTFRYYLANNLDLTSTLRLSKTDGGINETKDWGTAFTTGITYRLK
ncbi:MAG: Unknown protein [uncultured Sulfurovum sp.]|uniref:Uncharacterized protein n=1 Tax=uncultured Sulfurovum sp. TaxID=269237 RepID=A0A6S6TY92_9BACT|nr:MAG: Unknown protein [uncultured Sulfurovum sp.]